MSQVNEMSWIEIEQYTYKVTDKIITKCNSRNRTNQKISKEYLVGKRIIRNTVPTVFSLV